jgi:flagellum-specific peptidoglycan hydrolase FlgJ
MAQYKEAYVSQYAEIAVSEMHRTGIPASIKLAQAILESNYGRSELAREAHNHFGIKCGREWGGRGYQLKDDDYHNGELVHSCFRTYRNPEESFIAHSDFLSDPTKNSRYGCLFQLKTDDYKAWAEGLKKCGYATNPDYAKLLIRIIEEQQLYRFDAQKPEDLLASHNRRKDNHLIEPDLRETLSRSNRYVVRYQNELPYIETRAGDQIRTVAKQADISASRLLKYNENVDGRKTQLEEGTRLYLQPVKRKYTGNVAVHIVDVGETVQEIAHAYGVKSEILRKRNRIPEGCEPAPGTRLVLRGKQHDEVKCATPDMLLVDTRPEQKKTTAKPASAVASSPKNPEPRITSTTESTSAVEQASVIGLSEEFLDQITASASYTVQPKDTLFQIASRHGMTVSELKKINNLSTDVIQPGQSLKVQR